MKNLRFLRLASLLLCAVLVISTAAAQEYSWIHAGHSGAAKSVVAQSDETLVSLDMDSANFKRWDVRTGAFLGTTFFQPNDGYEDIDVSSQFGLIALAVGGEIALYSLADGNVRSRTSEPQMSYQCVRFAHRQPFFLAGGFSTGHFQLFEKSTSTGATRASYRMPRDAGSPKWIELTQDDNSFVVGCDNALVFWRRDCASPYAVLWTQTVCGAISPNGQTLATSDATKSAVTLWDTQSGLSVGNIPVALRVNSLTFDADDGSLIGALGPYSGSKGYIERWRSLDWHPAFIVATDVIRFGNVSTAPAGNIFVSGDFGVNAYDRLTGELRSNPVRSDFGGTVSFSPDGSRLIAGGKNATLIDPADGESIWSRSSDAFGGAQAAISPDGSIVAEGAAHSVDIISADSATWITSLPIDFDVAAKAFSPDGKQFAFIESGYSVNQQRLVVVDTSTWARLATIVLPRMPQDGPRFTADGHRLLMALDNGLYAYDTQHFQVVASTTLHGNDNPVFFSFAPDGNTIVATDEIYPNYYLRTLRADTLQQIGVLSLNLSNIEFAPDGSLWGVDSRGILKAIRVDNGSVLYKVRNPEIGGGFHLSKDGSEIAFIRGDGTCGLFPNPLH